MCLTTKTSVCSVSEKEIKCYKVLLLDSDMYVTPYQRIFVPKLVREGNIPFFADGRQNICKDYCEETLEKLSDSYIIGKGFIHTYKYFGSASNFKKHLEIMYPNLVCAIFECEIPIGTKYYEGQDDFFEMSFASEKIMFKKQLV